MRCKTPRALKIEKYMPANTYKTIVPSSFVPARVYPQGTTLPCGGKPDYGYAQLDKPVSSETHLSSYIVPESCVYSVENPP